MYKKRYFRNVGLAPSVNDRVNAVATVARSGGQQAPKGNIIIPGSAAGFANPAEMFSGNVFNLPTSAMVQVASATGASAARKTVYLLQQDTLNNVTDNGSGAASITYTYQDTFSGKVLSALVSQARAGVGAICYGVSIRMNVTSGGAGDPANLALTNPMFVTYDSKGKESPLSLDAAADQTRKDNDTSIGVWRCVQNLSKITQFSFSMPVGDTATVVFYMTPDFAI